MVLPNPRPSLSSGIHVKAREQSKPTVLSIRGLPKRSSLTGVKPSSRTILTPFLKRQDVERQPIGKTKISLTKGTRAAKHLPAPKTACSLSKPLTVIVSSTQSSSTRPSLTCPSKERNTPPFPVVLKRRVSNVISTNYVVNDNTTHRFSETLSRVSNRSSLLPSSEESSSPMAGEAKQNVESKGEPSHSPKTHKRSAERSTRFQRLISERVPILSSSDDIGEKRRIYDAVVNIQINRSEDSAPETTAISALPLSTSVPSFIHPMTTVSASPPSDEPSPPIEVVPRQRILNVVSQLLLASEQPHSPYPGTARRQSQQPMTPSKNEGEQLARAAAYIWERINRRSLTPDESVCCPSTVPPDKVAESESDSRRFDKLLVVNKEEEMSIVTICSPQSEDSEPSPTQSEAVPQQFEIWRATELSSEYSEAIPWLPGPVFDKPSSQWQRDLHAVSNVEPSMNSHSLIPNTALTPFSSSASTHLMQTLPLFQLNGDVLESEHQLVHPSTESRVDLNWFHTSQQCPWDVINMSINMASTIWYSWYSPKPKAKIAKSSPIPSETGRSSQCVPSSPQDVPRHFSGAVIRQRNLCAITSGNMPKI
jgi:hypothetical protein